MSEDNVLQIQATPIEALAIALNLGRNTTYEGVTSGDIPVIRVRGRKLVPNRWIEKQLGLEPGEFDPKPYMEEVRRRKARAAKAGQPIKGDQAA